MPRRDLQSWLTSGGKPTIATVIAGVMYSTWFVSGKIHDVETVQRETNMRIEQVENAVRSAVADRFRGEDFDNWLRLFAASNIGAPITVPPRH